METYFDKTDNSVTTNLQYDIIAEKNYKAYKNQIDKDYRNSKEDIIILNAIFWIIKYLVFLPIRLLVKFIFKKK
jgi:hypothetical protein